jgi:hypothetical protein
MSGCALLAMLLGCASPPRETGRAPDLAPPPAREGALSKEDALALSRSLPPERAIRALDEKRFGFVLDDAMIGWFQREGSPEEVVDYLRKRRRVNWEGLRGDVDPSGPEREYIDPRRGFDDWAGTGKRDIFSTERSRDPFAR